MVLIIILDGSIESVHYDEIIARIKQLCYGLEKIDPVSSIESIIFIDIVYVHGQYLNKPLNIGISCTFILVECV